MPKREARSKGPSFLTFRVRPGKFVQGRATPIYFRGQPMLRVTALFEGHLDADGVNPHDAALAACDHPYARVRRSRVFDAPYLAEIPGVRADSRTGDHLD